MRPLIVTDNFPQRKAIVKGLSAGFQYLEDRITGNCAAVYDYSHTYDELFRLAQVTSP